MPRPRASLSEKSKAPSIGGLIHSIQATPSKTPYLTAAITSVAWLFIGGLLGWLLVGQSLDDFSGYKSVLASSSFYILAASVLVPIALFWFIAQLVVRSQEMKLMASAMTEVAIRLAEPDKMAEQRVASVGQTIRRQVSAMDDAISRAIGRAGELEALVHNEVAALERSYSQNEYIIRNLLNELVSEREAIAHNGLQVKQALQGVSAQVSEEIRTATSTIGENLSQHGTMSALKLQRAGDQVTRALVTTTEQTVAVKQKISAELPQLLTKINTEQEKLGKVIDGARRNLTELDTTIAKRTTDLDNKLGTRTADLDSVIQKHTSELNKRLAQKVKALDANLAMRTRAMEKTLTSKASELNKTFLAHREEIDETMQKKAQEIDQAIVSQAKAMDASLTEKARTIDAVLTHRLNETAKAEQEKAKQPVPQNTPPGDNRQEAAKAASPTPEESKTVSMLRGSEALERAMTAQTKSLDENLQANTASLDHAIRQQNELSKEITSLSKKHKQLLKDQSEQITLMLKQFSAQGNDLKATAGLLASPDMKMSAMMGPQQNRARAILADLVVRSERMDKDRENYTSALDNAQNLAEETAARLKELLYQNASPRAEKSIAELDQACAQSRQNSFETKKWMQDYSASLSRHVVQMVSGMSRSSSRTKMLPGEVNNRSVDIEKSVKEQLQALDALAQIQGATVNSGQITSAGTGTGVSTGAVPGAGGPTPHGQGRRPLPANPPRLSHGRAVPRPGGNSGNQKPSQWSFGDLLARVADTDAEHDEQPLPAYRPTSAGAADPSGERKTGAGQDPLDVLRMDDIARALDSHTAALAWKRSQAGERQVFSRRLYTPEGQKTFDQISERYNSDETFRSTVEKYVIDFEGLIKQAQEKDPSGRIIQNYLTSESGRAYLMLAHICGRLG